MKAAQHYQIKLQGHLPDRWQTHFDGLTLTRTADGYTILQGPVVDQAALHGLFARIQTVGLVLVSVNLIAGEEESNEPHGK